MADMYGQAEDRTEPVQKFVVIHRRTQGHGQDEGQALGAHLPVQHQGPLLRQAAFDQAVVGQGLVAAAAHGLGQPAQDAVQEKEPEDQGTAGRGQRRQQHGQGKQRRGHDQQTLPAPEIGQGAGGHLGQHNGKGPGCAQQGKLLQTQAEVQKEHGKDRIVEACVEECPEEEKAPDIGQQEGRGWRYAHGFGTQKKPEQTDAAPALGESRKVSFYCFFAGLASALPAAALASALSASALPSGWGCTISSNSTWKMIREPGPMAGGAP